MLTAARLDVLRGEVERTLVRWAAADRLIVCRLPDGSLRVVDADAHAVDVRVELVDLNHN